MSRYTDQEHEEILETTLYWKSVIIETLKQEYEYGRYLERIKEYNEAVFWYACASGKGYIPASYAYLVCVMKELGVVGHQEDAQKLFPEVFTYYEEKKETPEDYYRLGMLYKSGWGTKQDIKKAFYNFTIASKQNFGAASYEIALYFESGMGGCEKSYAVAREYLRKAYEEHYEEAIFKDFELFRGDFCDYEYQREIKEAYSFKLGQFIRVAELRQTKESIQNVIQMYQNGYPGDSGEKGQEFIRKADKYIKMK